VTDAVLDASAILAVIRGEAGSDVVIPVMVGANVSAVTLAEVVSILARDGFSDSEIEWILSPFALVVVDLDKTQAMIAGQMAAKAKPFGLSLGDRCCLALAIQRGWPVYTADRIWTRAGLDADIRLIR
jgi:PIN domain nuclease of toxin-antitoxin system